MDECPQDERAMVEAVVARFSEAPRSGDYAELELQYYRKHAMPGRRYVRGPGAQKLSRAARKAAFASEAHASGGGGYVFVDVDINNCFPTLLLNKLRAECGDAVSLDFPVFCAFCENYKAWRSAIAEYLGTDVKDVKKMLVSIFHLGLPRHQLPFLWKLACEMREAVRALLGLQQFSYLEGAFADRPHPLASRLHYALAALEDNVLTDFEAAVLRDGGRAKIVTYMFDGAVLSAHSDDAPRVSAALAIVETARGVKFSLEQF